jgi:hypothetical protein
MLRLHKLKLAFASLISLVFWSGSAGAQCPVPDQLDGGPCCTVAMPVIPGFPKFTQDALQICWQNCNVSQTFFYQSCWTNVNILPPGGAPCGEMRLQLDLKATTGTVLWTGVLRAVYSRTWVEIDPAGFPIQVWRFLLNGNLRPALGVMPIPCPVPACAPAFNGSVRFTGYIDYAQNCGIAPAFYQHAWMLNHSCDFVDHHAGFPRAGAFHPDRAYTFVGPAAGFVPGPLQPTEGTPGSPFEALRRRNFPPLGAVGPVTCDFEERMQFSLLPIQQLCLCGPAAALPQYMIGNLTIFGTCGTTVTTPGIPYLPGFISMGIGSWTIPGVYPGVEVVRWNTGGYDFTDPCPPLTRREVFYGATTIGGYPAFQLSSIGPPMPLPTTFIDQANSLTPPNGTGTVMNVPYVSDHILNLNH